MTSFQDAVPFWLSVGSRILGWRPDEFWCATPAELLGALREPETLNGASPPSRELINQMLERERNG